MHRRRDSANDPCALAAAGVVARRLHTEEYAPSSRLASGRDDAGLVDATSTAVHWLGAFLPSSGAQGEQGRARGHK